MEHFDTPNTSSCSSQQDEKDGSDLFSNSKSAKSRKNPRIGSNEKPLNTLNSNDDFSSS